jgi:hypothetical protein
MNTHPLVRSCREEPLVVLSFFMEIFLSLTYDDLVAMAMNIGGTGISFHVVWEESAGFSE